MVLKEELLTVLRAVPAKCLILLPDVPRFTIVEATEEYLNATMRDRDNVVGNGIFEAFPGNPSDPFSTGPQNLNESLLYVLERRQKHLMPTQKYDILKPDLSFEERYWLPTNTPVLDANGEVSYIIHKVEDATRLVRAEKKGFVNEWQFNLAFDHSAFGMGVIDESGTFINVNDSFCKLLGYKKEEILKLSYTEIIPSYDQERIGRFVKNLISHRTNNATLKGLYYHSNGDLLSVEQKISVVRDKLNIFQHFVVQVEHTTERYRIESQLARREQQYQSLFNQNPDAVFSLDHEGYFSSVNRSSCKLFNENFQGLQSKRLVDFCTTESKEKIVNLFERGLEGNSETAKVSILACPRQIKHVSVTMMPIIIDEVVTGVFGIAKDITDLVNNRNNLKKLSLIAEKTVNAVIISDGNERIEWVNQAFLDLTGFSFEDVAGRVSREFLYGEKTDPATSAHIAEKVKRKQPFKCEILKYTKFGKPFWVEIEGHPLFGEQGELSHYFEIETDITERKQVLEKSIKKEKQVRGFAGQLNKVLEDERARIAREIHDEIGQQLVGLKMSIGALKNSKRLKMSIEEVVEYALVDIGSAISSLKKFATELRPGILDSLGLFPSIEWLLKDFQKKTGLKCELISSPAKAEISREIGICFFRVCQEALTNVAKHAEASCVRVEIDVKEQLLFMNIVDDGRGIVTDKLDDPFSMGLIGMDERAKLIGGYLTIDSSPQQGTNILLTVNV